MNKDLARKHDKFLTFLTCAFIKENRLNRNDLVIAGSQMEISKLETSIILDILVSDGLLPKHIQSFEGDQILNYSHNPTMTKFIFVDEGYKKKRVKEYRESTNTIFTFYKNWIWLIGFVLSLVLNGYLILKLYILN